MSVEGESNKFVAITIPCCLQCDKYFSVILVDENINYIFKLRLVGQDFRNKIIYNSDVRSWYWKAKLTKDLTASCKDVR